MREPIPDELWKTAADLSRRYPTSLVGRVLKLDPSKLKKLLIKRSPGFSPENAAGRVLSVADRDYITVFFRQWVVKR
jgi:hypothetical protein